MASKTTITVTQVGGGGGFRAGVQGIASNLDDVKLLGQSWRAQVGDALLGGTLERTIEAASTLQLDIHDDRRKLLESDLLTAPFDVELDGLGFTFVQASSQGFSSPLGLTFESRTVNRMRQFRGPKKAFRDKLTRAEFINRLRLQAAKGWGRIPFEAPQLHKIQPIKTARDSRAAATDAQTSRRGGLGAGVKLTVKGAPASSAQIAMGDRILRQGASLGAPQRALVASIVAAIVENLLSNSAGGTGSSDGLYQLLDGTAASLHIDAMNVEQVVEAFFKVGFTGAGGAIKLAKQGLSPAAIADGVEGPAAGASSYAPYVAEAQKWVEAFGGEASSSSVTATETQRYSYEIEAKENFWTGSTRLAGEVGWRLFESNGRIYYVAEPFLMRSKVRVLVSDEEDGIEDITFDYDTGKPINELTVSVRAKAWGAPPGTVAVVQRCGPANGRYLVTKISSPLRTRNSLCDVTLRRPIKPTGEPAATTKTKRVALPNSKFASASGADALGLLEGTPEDVVNRVVDYAHANGFPGVTRATVRAANAAHGPTISGSISDHQGPPSVRWAADISNGTTTKEETHLAATIAKAFNIPWSGSGLVTVTHGSYRMQLIYKTMEGGNHFDHVHFGCAKA